MGFMPWNNSTPIVNHNHIFQKDTPGCVACDWYTGRVASFPFKNYQRTPTIYPALTSEQFNLTSVKVNGIPLVESEEGEYIFGYGHIGEQVFADACTSLHRDTYYVPMTQGFDPSYHVRHVNVVCLTPPGEDEWVVSWKTEYADHPNSFPITVLDVEGWL